MRVEVSAGRPQGTDTRLRNGTCTANGSIVVEAESSPIQDGWFEVRAAEEIFGDVDALKLRSSLTVFGRAAPHQPIFARSLRKYFGASEDPKTLARL